LLRDGARLLTLTGPGGSGKTRLAIEAAAQLVAEFKAGVFWVELATVKDPALVSETIAQTLGAKQGLAEHIGERQVMLLLDNLEQVIAAGAALAALVEGCPNLRLLVTSRELLRVRGEREYPVPPLADSEAIALFCDRAGIEPDTTVRELCRALDNLPLAVELAAARARVLAPRQILERLAGRLDLLKGRRDADPRQQTLRATIEWSHDLLSPSEQALFARMSVFAGGCTLDAAEAVADADLDELQSLVDKSLVRHVDERFWMLELIRAYAAESLDKAGATEDLRRRHAHHYLEGDGRRSATILAATEAVREATGMPPDEDEAEIRQIALDRLGAQPTAFADAWEFGRGLDVVGAFEFAKAGGADPLITKRG
jgi:predicted ATPase